MSDVTRFGSFAGVYVLDDGEMPGRGYITESDHLAALERVRVETLREAKRAVINNDGWLDAMKAIDKAIDRLIDATTTGATDA